MSYTAGSIVRARGREWVVLPGDSDPRIVMLKPLGGSDAEIVGILPSLEKVESASFAPPDPTRLGDWTSARLLREAARLSTRNAAGAIRCWSRIDADPRPYQLVPLLMALKMDTVRLLIADDVGIGKTIESLLIARELYDRGEISRIAVLAPPALVDQWVTEMGNKFHLDAVPVLAGTAARLERDLPAGRSLFEEYPVTVVSLDFIKAEKRRAEFLRTCPEFVIVDEAHACAAGIGVRHQRYQLLESLSEDSGRHILLVTATPHSGKGEAFGSLVSLLSPEIRKAASTGNDIKDLLAPKFVQRRRPDIRSYLETTTNFPKREEKEVKYLFSDAYRTFFQHVLDYIQGSMTDTVKGSRTQRVRWWSALALLRAVSSSPRAAAATLRTRAAPAVAETATEADELGKNVVLDQDAMDGAEGMDAVAGSAETDGEGMITPLQRKLRELARTADAIPPKDDAKLQLLMMEVKALLADGFKPIIFCRFIETAEYVAEQLRTGLAKDREWKDRTQVACVTGLLAPEDRRTRIDELSEERIGEQIPVLVATDCLSEGVNLQDRFTAVIHYDLAWNPTRHEQREGRVDRFGQKAKTVRALTLYGANNPVDGIVLDILIRKHVEIVKVLGVSIPVPMDSNDVLAAIMEGMDFRSVWRHSESPDQTEFDFGQDLLFKRKRLHDEWDDAAKRDKETRTRFAQRSIDPDEVARELAELRASAGDRESLRWFMEQALKRLDATVTPTPTVLKVNPQALPEWLKEHTGLKKAVQFGFDDQAPQNALRLTRSHPIVATLSNHVLESALDSQGRLGEVVSSRAGVIKTEAVRTRTVLILTRFRYDIIMGKGANKKTDLAEDVGAIAFFTGTGGAVQIVGPEAEALFGATSSGNVPPDLARDALARELGRLEERRPHIAAEARRRAEAYAASFERLKTAARLKGGIVKVEPRGEPDILGLYIYQPGGAS